MSSLQIHSLEDGCTKCGKPKKKGCCGNGEGANNEGNYNIINIGNDQSKFSNEELRFLAPRNNAPSVEREKVFNTVIKEPPQTRIVEKKVPVTNGESVMVYANSDNKVGVPARLFNDSYRTTLYREFY